MPPAATPTQLNAEPSSSSSSKLNKQHFSIDVSFPIYAISFLQPKVVTLGGGGGSSRTGVKNRLSSYRIDTTLQQFNLVQEYDLSKTEDAPMSIAVNPITKQLVAGINSSVEKLKEGVNENLRLFNFNDEGLKFERSKQTINSLNEDHYQKVTTFSRTSPSLISIGSTNSQLSVLTFPKLEEIFPSLNYEGEEIYDTDFDDSGEMVIGTSSKKLCVWSTKILTKGDLNDPIQIIERPIIRKELTCTFRAAKFGRKNTSKNIYTIINTTPAVRSKKAGRNDKKSYISLWDMKSWSLKKSRCISLKPITAFDISDDGTLLAFGSSDLSVGILDSITLNTIIQIQQAHQFPVTSLKFNPTSDLVISGSADNSVKVILIPPISERGRSSTIWKFLLTLIILILAILVQASYSKRGHKWDDKFEKLVPIPVVVGL